MLTVVLFPLLLASTSVTADPVQSSRVPVSVDLVGDDGLTQKLSNGLKRALEKNLILRPASANDSNIISITSDSNVNWDKLEGRTVVIYTVRIFRGKQRGEPNVGICYENRMTKCVNAIVRLAQIEAEGW